MREILTVTQLNQAIKILMETSWESLWVEGEISNLRRPRSGHVYFTLKDEHSQIRGVFFRAAGPYAKGYCFELEDGLKVLCRARLNVYLPRGEYQLVVESFEPLGIGALQKAFEQLKVKLSAEGLFDERHKKPLPFLPKKIGVITSPTGAVIRDILSITARRFPSLDVLVAPVRVQGADAAAEIIEALRHFNDYGEVDVIIIARGGGSLEDLAPFNDEGLAREIFQSSIPVVSAVGHETDFTICDFVADLRAPTPSAAAELVAPERSELLSRIGSFRERIISCMFRSLEDRRVCLTDWGERLKDPRRTVFDIRMRVDELQERLISAFGNKRRGMAQVLRQWRLRMEQQNPMRKVEMKKNLLENLRKDLVKALSMRMTLCREKIKKTSAVLESLSPLAVLRRGYSIATRAADGAVITDATGLELGEDIHIRLARGSVDARIEEIFQGE